MVVVCNLIACRSWLISERSYMQIATSRLMVAQSYRRIATLWLIIARSYMLAAISRLIVARSHTLAATMWLISALRWPIEPKSGLVGTGVGLHGNRWM